MSAGRGFWFHVLKIAEHKLHTKAMHDRKCPNCLRWVSSCGYELAYLDPWSEQMICHGCGWRSDWDCHYMLPVLISPHVAADRLANVDAAP